MRRGAWPSRLVLLGFRLLNLANPALIVTLSSREGLLGRICLVGAARDLDARRAAAHHLGGRGEASLPAWRSSSEPSMLVVPEPGCEEAVAPGGRSSVTSASTATAPLRRAAAIRLCPSTTQYSSPILSSSTGGRMARRLVACWIRCQRESQLVPRSCGSGRKSVVFCDGCRAVPAICASGTVSRPLGCRLPENASGWRSNSDGKGSRGCRQRAPNLFSRMDSSRH